MQYVFSNGKYEKVNDVHGYFLYADYYKNTKNYFFRAMSIHKKFDIHEEIKAVSFMNSKDGKTILEQNIKILM